MTYRIFNQTNRLVKFAVPAFFVIAVFLLIAFKGTIAAADNEQNSQCAEQSSIELTYLGFNP